MVVIAMVGAPFSPWYARARARARDTGRAADPLRFCAFNVALYRRQASTWALVETDGASRSADAIAIGGSHFERNGGAFDVRIDTRTPLISRSARIRGRVHASALVQPTADAQVTLDVTRRHSWRPVAPLARVEVDFAEPRARWSGWGYVDKNTGEEPLENAFRSWTWSRAHLEGHGGAQGARASLIHYDVEARDGARTRLVRAFGEEGDGARRSAREAEEVHEVRLAPTRWGLERNAFADRPQGARLLHALEDTPFYARSLVETTVAGRPTRAVHEVLSLDRFRAPWVRLLLPFRMRREAPR